ncbi:MAG: anti-sigma factor [Deltaproteobacteria bacterium]|nr:anti-sigma factor [Deltaproteobacteria bacterium]MBW2415485.1 anti-sigma factor [Deltaproteobacteria bacterium]
MTGEDRRDDVLLYASGALEGSERDEVERYLAKGGPRAAGELAEAEATLAHLALSLDPLDPPDRVKHALLERVSAARPRLLRPRPATPHGSRPGRSPQATRRRGVSRTWLRTAVAVGLALPLAWFGAYTTFAARVGGLERELVEQSASLNLLAVADGKLEVKVIELEGPALRRRGFGRMYQNWQTGDCYLFAHGIRRPADGMSYRAWFTGMDGELVRGPALRIDERGDASLLTRLPRNVDLGAPVVVTLEADGSASGPTGTPQLVGEYRVRARSS